MAGPGFRDGPGEGGTLGTCNLVFSMAAKFPSAGEMKRPGCIHLLNKAAIAIAMKMEKAV